MSSFGGCFGNRNALRTRKRTSGKRTGLPRNLADAVHAITRSRDAGEASKMPVEHFFRDRHAGAARHAALEHGVNGAQTGSTGELALEAKSLLHLLVPPADTESLRAFAVISGAAAVFGANARNRIHGHPRVKPRSQTSGTRM